MSDSPTLEDLVVEYRRSLAYTDALSRHLSAEEVQWRPQPKSSAIGWHLGHQAAVAHFMVRNLTAAEPSPDPGLDSLMDGATPEEARGDLPDIGRIWAYRENVTARVEYWVKKIAAGDVASPYQLRSIAETMMTAIVNHEYQHSKWIGEVSVAQFGHDLPDAPVSSFLTEIEGYVILA